MTAVFGRKAHPTRSQYGSRRPQRHLPPRRLEHRPAEGVTNELNLVAGFNFAPDQPATLTVGGKSFDLFTQKDAAWLLDASQNDNLAGALRTLDWDSTGKIIFASIRILRPI